MKSTLFYFLKLSILLLYIVFVVHSPTVSAKNSIKINTQPFELPLNGATGFASVNLDMYVAPKINAALLLILEPGQAFTILEQQGQWLYIFYAGQEGYVRSLYSMINLPDVIPSIIYKHTNASASILVSSGKNIPNITGEILYDALHYNNRFQEQSYIMPVLFSTALKIQAAQKMALADNNTLVIYEAFRPYAVQRKISANLSQLMKKDAQVRKGITQAPWSIGWFVSLGTSNHQRGYAIDVSLAKINEMENLRMGTYAYTRPKRYTEYMMPSAMHELSTEAVVFAFPVNSRSATAWKKAAPSPRMTKEALLLQKYCTENGLTPLASEWWHFNDLGTGVAVGKRKSDGKYYVDSLVSLPYKLP